MKALFLLLLLNLLSPSFSVYQQEQSEDKPVVKTKYGYVQGFQSKSKEGRQYYAFTKIPYAKPPLGKLRFQSGIEPDSWDGILEANKNVPHCWQIPVYDPLNRHLTFGTEDCLYLSIFTPKVSSENKLPVLVFIHGGGWRSELPKNGPSSRADSMMDKDVVLVDFNYRLGPLGFMSTEDDVLPGNLGMKDQAQVIRWVVDNIGNFGGDPKKITLFGNSAGGASTHYHLISPMTKDLIQGGISQSGFATCLWALNAPGVTADRTKRLAKHLGCPVDSSKQLVECLETKPAEDITSAERLFIQKDYLPTIAFPPVMEHGENPFLSDNPYNLKVEKPWILGMTSEDGAFKLAGLRATENLMDDFIENGKEVLPEAIMFTNTTTKSDEISKSIFDFYYRPDNVQKGFMELWTDGFFTHCLSEAIKKTDNAYVYIYHHRGKTTWLDLQAKEKNIDNSDLGASHTDELFSLFNFDDILTEPDMISDADRKVSRDVLQIWTDFATYGYPKWKEAWEPYNKDGKYLNISEHSQLQSDLWPDRIQFWSSLPLRDKITQN